MNYQDFLNELNKSGNTTLKKNYSVSCGENCTLEVKEHDEITNNSGEVYGKFGVKHRVVVQHGELFTESNLPPGVHYRINAEGRVQIPYYYENDSRYLGGFYKGNNVEPVYHDVVRIGLYVEKPLSIKGKKIKSTKPKAQKAEMPLTPDGFIAFNKVSEPFGWMSNMSSHAVEKDGKKWRSAEALFQAMRFANNPEIQDAIFNQTNPMGVKFIAKKKDNLSKMSIKPGSEEDYAHLREIIRLKLEQNSDLKNELLATGENVIFDNAFLRKDREAESVFWGAYFENGTLTGENRLGKIWMELRDGLKK